MSENSVLGFYEFSGFRFDPRTNELAKGDSIVHLPQRIADTLQVLLNNPNEVISKEEFFHVVWEDSFVEDGNLTVSIAHLRKAIQELGEDIEIIKTIPKKGYKLITAVSLTEFHPEDVAIENIHLTPSVERIKFVSEDPNVIVPPDFVLSNSRSQTFAAFFVKRSVYIAFGLMFLGLAVFGYWYKYHNSSKVVRFLVVQLQNRNKKGDEDKNNLVGFAISDRLISDLSLVKGAKVTPIWMVSNYSSDKLADVKFEDGFSPDVIITGSYFTDNGRLLVTIGVTQLLDGENTKQQTFDLDENLPISEVQETIARRVFSSFGIRSLATFDFATERKNYSNAGYLEYINGIDYYSRSNYEKAIQSFEKSVEESPNFAGAWNRLGRAYLTSALTQFSDDSFYNKAEFALKKAVDIEPDNAVFQVDLGEYDRYLQNYQEAAKHFQNASNLDKDNAYLSYCLAIFYRYIGKTDKSIELTEKYLAATRGRAGIYLQYIYSGDYKRFSEFLDKSADGAYENFYLGYIELYNNNFELAKSFFDKAYKLSSDGLQQQIGKVFSYQLGNEPQKATALLNEIEQKLEKQNQNDGEGIYKVAQAFLFTGQKDKALKWMRKSVNEGFYQYSYFQSDPLMKPLKDNPEFAAIVDLAKQKSGELQGLINN